jgi:hypothetical protein
MYSLKPPQFAILYMFKEQKGTFLVVLGVFKGQIKKIVLARIRIVLCHVVAL